VIDLQIASWDALIAILERDYADGSLNAIYLSGHGNSSCQGIRCSGGTGWFYADVSPTHREVIGRKLSADGILAFMGCGAAAPANNAAVEAFKMLAADIAHDVIGNSGQWYIGHYSGDGFMIRYFH
jgi:hypothetical protein